MSPALKTRRGVMVVLLALALVWIPAAASPVCSCDDVAQIQYRIAEDQAAIDAYNKYLKTEPAILGFNTVGAYNKMEAYVEAAMGHPDTTLSRVFPPGELAKTGYYDGKCQTILPNYSVTPTPCMAKAIDDHEAIHRKACEDEWDKPILGKRKGSLVAKLDEEIAAYTAEKTFLEAEKARLLCNCDYYAIRFETSQTMDNTASLPGGGSDHQHQDWALQDDAGHPFVQFPLHLTSGTISGKGSGRDHAVITDTSSVEACDPNREPKSGNSKVDGYFASGFEISGTMARAFSPTLTATRGDLIGNGVCVEGGTTRTYAVDQPGHSSDDTTLHFTKINDPFEIVSAVPNSMFKATLLVDDQWKGRKASNGQGSTVDQALEVIGLCDCPSNAP